MKIRSFLLSMLVVAGFSACSDDVIDNGGNEVGTTDATPAYLTISFSANSSGSSRSTADDANNIGDQDGSAEDSEHYNVGTEDENRIEKALVVVLPSSTVTSASTAFAKLYTIADASNVVTNGTASDPYGFGYFDLVNTTNLTYAMDDPIKLSVGEYKVLVVANPIKDLWTIDDQELDDVTNEGLTTVKDVKAIYEKIVNGTYNSDITDPTMPWTGELIHETTASTDASKQYAFMMANKAECTVTLTEADTPENPKKATVDIERVVSKITFRHTGEGENKDRYPIAVDYAVEVETVNATVDNQTVLLYRATLNKDNSEIFISKAQDGTLTAYTESNGTYTKSDDFSGQESDITYVTKNTGTAKWYVEIVGYALVNLSKEVNYVRHTGVANANAPFGTLDGSNFLVTPYWNAKNAVTFNEDKTFVGTPAVGTWFYDNTILANVSDASKTDNADIFNSFDEDYETSDDEAVTGNGTQHPETGSTLDNIGETLAYCLENSTDVEHQVHGLSTGIAFQAKMYAEDGSEITTLYRYAGNVFTSIKSIQDAYGSAASDEIKKLTENSSDEDLAAAKVTKYNDNTCYYYTTEIKHFDNNNSRELGNMEFAIMRNNIYSLSITGINRIGDPFVDPTPGPENESKEAALSVQAKIVPWIVRYHDIEF